MSEGELITRVWLSSASACDRASGLVAWLSVELAGLVVVDGLTLRRTLRGDLRVGFPARVDRSGKKRFFLRPTGELARRELDRQILAALNLPGEEARR